MAISRQTKEALVQQYGEGFSASPHAFLLGFDGITVEQVDDLRNRIRDNGGHYTVVKNRLALLAIEGTALNDLADHFTGPTGVAFSPDDPVGLAKALTGFAKENPKIVFKAGVVDGQAVDWHDTINYRGMMFTGVPNLAWVFGYFRASWTLRVDMLGDFVCGLLNHMDSKGASRVDVALRPEDEGMEILPWIEEENFNPGYLMRGIDQLPQRGAKPKWRHNQDYWTERVEIPAIDLEGDEFVYGGGRSTVPVTKKEAEPVGA